MLILIVLKIWGRYVDVMIVFVLRFGWWNIFGCLVWILVVDRKVCGFFGELIILKLKYVFIRFCSGLMLSGLN